MPANQFPPSQDPLLTADEAAMEDLRMNFGDHLEELRKRLLLSLAGTAVLFLVTLYYGSYIVVWLLKPLIAAQRQAGIAPMTVAGITSGFTTYILVAIASALILASPWVFYQLWQFIAAGLYASERKMFITLAPLSAFMSAIGICFLYYVLLPVGLFFFLSFTTNYPQVPPTDTSKLADVTSWINDAAVKYSGISSGESKKPKPVDPEKLPAPSTTQPAVLIPTLTADPVSPVEGELWIKQPEGEVRIWLKGESHTLTLAVNSLITPLVHVGEYLKFVAFLALGVVLAFQTPVIMLVLAWSGLVQASLFKKYRRHALLVCFVLAAILTPPDPITMTMLAVPMYLLFETGLLLMTLAARNADHHDPADDAEESTS